MSGIFPNVFVTNDTNAIKPTAGATSLNKTIADTPIVVLTDSDLSAAADKTKAGTLIVQVQVKTQPVWVNFHGETPSATTGIELAVGTILYLSRSAWLNSRWLRSTGSSGAIVVQQFAAT
jgi:hypothetical protein